jgi:AcrR family transcriptional regulator
MIRIHLEPQFYLRNPEETELGRKIVSTSIRMIDEMGLEEFTFRKLAHEIGSTEASVYRYFESKHRLLIYLLAWHWRWLQYQIDYETHNLSDPHRKLDLILHLLARPDRRLEGMDHIDGAALLRIVISESPKGYFTKEVDDENKEGLFRNYKQLTQSIAQVITEVSASYPFPRALASTLIEASHQQTFFADHLPGLTDVSNLPDASHPLEEFLRMMVYGQLKG